MYAPNQATHVSMSEPDVRLVDDDLFVERAKHDPDAFEHIYDLYKDPIYRMCLRATGDPDLADDLTAAVFLKAFERLDRYRPQHGCTFRSWLFTLARNTVHDHWRRDGKSTPGETQLSLNFMQVNPDAWVIYKIGPAAVGLTNGS